MISIKQNENMDTGVASDAAESARPLPFHALELFIDFLGCLSTAANINEKKNRIVLYTY